MTYRCMACGEVFEEMEYEDDGVYSYGCPGCGSFNCEPKLSGDE